MTRFLLTGPLMTSVTVIVAFGMAITRKSSAALMTDARLLEIAKAQSPDMVVSREIVEMSGVCGAGVGGAGVNGTGVAGAGVSLHVAPCTPDMHVHSHAVLLLFEVTDVALLLQWAAIVHCVQVGWLI